MVGTGGGGGGWTGDGGLTLEALGRKGSVDSNTF